MKSGYIRVLDVKSYVGRHSVYIFQVAVHSISLLKAPSDALGFLFREFQTALSS